MSARKVGKATLEAAAAASYARMLAAGMPETGYVNSFRSRAEQQRLYDLYRAGKGNLAAKPGTSNHEKGTAFDASTGSAMQRWLTHGDTHDRVGSKPARANAYGWVRDVSSEPWHFHYIPAKDTKAKAAPKESSKVKYQHFKKPGGSQAPKFGKWLNLMFQIAGVPRRRFYSDADGTLESRLYVRVEHTLKAGQALRVRARLVRDSHGSKPVDPTAYDERVIQPSADGWAGLSFQYQGLAEKGRRYYWQVRVDPVPGSSPAPVKVTTRYCDFWRR